MLVLPLHPLGSLVTVVAGIWLTAHLAKVFCTGVASARLPSHRVTPQSPWVFFDAAVRPRTAALWHGLLAVFACSLVLPLVGWLAPGSAIPPTLVPISTACFTVPLWAASSWCLCYGLAPHFADPQVLAIVIVLSLALWIVLIMGLLTLLPVAAWWSLVLAGLGLTMLPVIARLRGPAWFRFEE